MKQIRNSQTEKFLITKRMDRFMHGIKVHKRAFRATPAFFMLAATASFHLSAQTFTDDFEGASIDSFWTATGPGTASLSNSVSYTGSQSLQLSASTTYPWQATLSHDFGSAQSGSVSVYLQGQDLCCGSGAGLGITSGDGFALIQQSGNINCNSCFVARVRQPGFPESSTPFSFNAPASAWHFLEISADQVGVTFKFDGAAIFSSALITGFDGVNLSVWGGPGGTGYLDQFSVTRTGAPTEPLTITGVAADPAVLWPPNHAMIPVAVSPVTSGGSDPVSCNLTSVTSNEPPGSNAVAAGDAVLTGNLTLNLRAERSGSGTGRVYTITVRCTDVLANSATKTATVVVPHDQGR